MPDSIYYPSGKRLLDLFLSATALLILSPLFYFIAILIKIESTGSVFFKQERIGKDLKKFKLIKFRSMTANKDSEKRQFEPGSNNRVTKIGDILRRTKIDELPELFNILAGDMSIVGPRPEVGKYIKYYTEDFREILKIRPGLSDYASIKYRNEEEILSKQSDPETYYIETILPNKLRLANEYKNKINFKTDASIIFETLKRIFSL